VAITVNAAPSGAVLTLADTPSRTGNPRPIDGAVLRSGVSAYIFVGGTGIGDVRRVDFTLDGNTFTTEQVLPFDFAGTSEHRPCRACVFDAHPFESNLLTLGSHQIRATLVRDKGARTVLDATFTVADDARPAVSPRRIARRPGLGSAARGRKYVFLGTRTVRSPGSMGASCSMAVINGVVRPPTPKGASGGLAGRSATSSPQRQTPDDRDRRVAGGGKICTPPTPSHQLVRSPSTQMSPRRPRKKSHKPPRRYSQLITLSR
jgi:hypothetical protein